MSEWLGNPVTFLLALALILAIWRGIAWFPRVDKDLLGLKKSLADLKDAVTAIQEDIKRIFHVLTPPTRGQSPAQLTEYGERISRVIDGKAWAARRAPDLVAEVGGMAEYLVEEFCRKYVRARLKADEKDMVLRAMYEVGTNREDVLAVLTIILRDELFKQRHARENR